MNVPVPLVCLALPLQMSELTRSETGRGPSLAQGSTGPPEEEVLGGTGGPQGSALGGGHSYRGREETQCEGRVNTTTYRHNTQQGRSRKLGWVPTVMVLSLTSDTTDWTNVDR